ncbi:MAG TPA: hypothetical protein VG225_02285 [Terracidiphilus sp.]|jgi:4-diphosphocytidyl-2-C-methyl-D-erythritol kinase|nr:hypothetical protein [Terracidiphilus sp.]
MPTSVRSHAKINLGLGIGAPRSDGFHSLVTVYQTLEAHDLVSVSVRRPLSGPPRPENATVIRVTSNDRRVPTDGRNTAWKMVSLVLEELEMTADVEIHIEKRLPVQGGLGAGSGNAVAALLELERATGVGLESRHDWYVPGQAALQQWGAKQSASESHGDLMARWSARRLELAARVGSDVPLFLVGGTVLGLDRGQEVYPLPDFEPVWCVLALPETGVSTPQAFRDWDQLCAAEGLTAEASTDKLKELSRAYASAFAGAIPEGRQGTGSSGVPAHAGDLAGPTGSALVRTGITSWIQNDFEGVVFRQHPSLAEIKRILAADGTPEAALHASLSGSGSALYGLYLTREAAEAACERLQAAAVRSTLTRTLPRSPYWGEMLQP